MITRNWVRHIALTIALPLILSACGGGGGTSTSSNATSGTGSSTVNTIPITIDNSFYGQANVPYVSITLCQPGSTTNCQTVDHILVDTGSVGLRVYATALSNYSGLNLTQQTDSSGNSIGECLPFADGYVWGPIKTANLILGGESANNMPVQIMSDPAFAATPNSCSMTAISESSSTAITTPEAFGANGVLGVGLFQQDCGYGCATSSQYDVYYSCAGQSCTSITMPTANQVPNPTSLFAADNNGVIISLPSVGAGGVLSVSGSLIFGIDTQSDNASSSASTVLTTDPNTGYISTTYNQQVSSSSFLDSGSNGYFFNDGTINQCTDATGFYCPSSTLQLSAVMTGYSGTNTSVNFTVENTDNLFNNNPTYAAFSTLAGTASSTITDYSTFDWGLPFFYGKRVYTAIEGGTTNKGTGPYFAW